MRRGIFASGLVISMIGLIPTTTMALDLDQPAKLFLVPSSPSGSVGAAVLVATFAKFRDCQKRLADVDSNSIGAAGYPVGTLLCIGTGDAVSATGLGR